VTALIEETRGLLSRAREVYAGTPYESRVQGMQQRLDEPLRVAIAGKVKAGKSTLLNALVGAQLAPTDAGECTRLVTWYSDGPTYAASADLVDGRSEALSFESRGDAFHVSLGDLEPEEIGRIIVTWPSSALRTKTLIDTPGVGSLSSDVSTRAVEFLAADDEDTPTDAVLYLMKHLHGKDVELLRSFHDTEVSHPNPVNALGVLSRADEIGAGRLDAMDSARRVAGRIASEVGVRQLVQTVVPVVGLLAETAATLTEAEFRRLAAIADRPATEVDAMLLSADRFVAASAGSGLSADDHEHLLGRFAIFGIRSTTSLIRSGEVSNAGELSAALLRLSGLDELQRILASLFVERGDILKARSALLGLDRLVRSAPDGAEALRGDLERVLASAHEFAELRTLSAIRSGWVTGNHEVLAELERLLGSTGTSPAARLGMPEGTGQQELSSLAAAALARWQRTAEHPLTKPILGIAARVAIRSCEGILSAAE
jgi:hypothetical protein